MAYTTNQLIAGAYYASGVVSREFETVSGTQYSDGLQWLNEILADKDVDQAMIPYETTYRFNSSAGQEVYFIPDLIQIDTIVFYLNGVRFSLNYDPRNNYFGSGRVENINALPYKWYWERKTGGGNLYLYFKPSQDYPIEIHGIFRIKDFKLLQNLEDNTAYADLGKPIFYSGGLLSDGQFVVNDIDLRGNYPNIGSLVNYINTGIISGVKAKVDVNGNFVLYSDINVPVNITCKTKGYPPNGTNYVTNVEFATEAPLPAYTYNNGNLGVGATITANSNGALVVDGYTVQLNDRVLVKDGDSDSDNGVYTVIQVGSVSLPFILTRLASYNKSFEINNGNLFTAISGIVGAGKTFIQTETVSSVGLDPIIFDNFSALTFQNFSTIYLPDVNVYDSLSIDKFYLTYLRYALADRICAEYALKVPEKIYEQLKTYESLIRKKSRILDLRMTKVSTLGKRGSLNWGFVNLGRGWTAD